MGKRKTLTINRCIISQLIFTLGGSIFPGGNGSMMIEAVPFFHILVNIIESEIGDDVSDISAVFSYCKETRADLLARQYHCYDHGIIRL